MFSPEIYASEKELIVSENFIFNADDSIKISVPLGNLFQWYDLNFKITYEDIVDGVISYQYFGGEIPVIAFKIILGCKYINLLAKELKCIIESVKYTFIIGIELVSRGMGRGNDMLQMRISIYKELPKPCEHLN
jgi:hypothetical protein